VPCTKSCLEVNYVVKFAPGGGSSLVGAYLSIVNSSSAPRPTKGHALLRKEPFTEVLDPLRAKVGVRRTNGPFRAYASPALIVILISHE